MQAKTSTLDSASVPYRTSFGVHDILFVLFKHKGKIGLFTGLGFLCAIVVFFLYPATYESQAKLLVRYVVERSAVDALDSTTAANPANRSNVFAPAIASEIEILTSWDLAVQVAEAVGPKRLLPSAKGPVDQSTAANVVSSGLEVTAAKGGNILFVSYTNHDPQITALVLDELVKRYFTKHLEVHRSAGAFDFVTQQTDQVRARLNQTEDALKALKQQAGIVSLNESRISLSAEQARSEEQLRAAQTEFAEQQARVNQLEGVAPPTPPAIPPAKKDAEAKPEASAIPQTEVANTPVPQATPTTAQLQEYDVLISRITQLRQSAVDLLARYTPQNPLVKANEAQLVEVDRQKRDLETKFPELASRSSSSLPSRGPQTDLMAERARLSGLSAKVETLKIRVAEVQAKVKQLADLGPQIAELERRREMEEANYKYFQSTLEKARVDEALDPSKIPNITAVQKPSPPVLVTKQRDKLAGGFAVGGLVIGLVLSLLFELILNRTVKRPLELERQLSVPLLLSVPFTGRNGIRRLSPGTARKGNAMSKESAGAKVAPWAPGHFIRPYCEAIRDRLGLYFELHQLTHKPKLIGVAGFSRGAGTSTLAAGLAAALSETDDGKVLLVDANLGPTEVHPFFDGKPAYPLANALDSRTAIDAASENLYLATVGSPQNGLAQLGVKKFFDMMPNLKASDFDYIIFDMPPLSQTSPTWGMSAFMDKMLLVVEAEKNNRDMVKRGHAKLLSERNNVSVVFNKAQSYGPKWVEGEN